MTVNPSIAVQLITCTIGCVGFALLFHATGRSLLWNAVGAFLTWTIYLVAYHFRPSAFIATAIAATFVATYAQIMARVCKLPATVFQTASVFPVVPGVHLYYMMYNLVMQQPSEALLEFHALLLGCLGIILGFFVVEICNKYIVLARK
ncbi:MAG: threonine/serine exporter family protein [Mogibacterium sp.]|nr:threonine/serine exporter family protein [Mogibacterium sp.]